MAKQFIVTQVYFDDSGEVQETSYGPFSSQASAQAFFDQHIAPTSLASILELEDPIPYEEGN